MELDNNEEDEAMEVVAVPHLSLDNETIVTMEIDGIKKIMN